MTLRSPVAGESIMKEGGGSAGPSVCLRLHSSFGGSALPRLPVVVVMDQMWANCQGKAGGKTMSAGGAGRDAHEPSNPESCSIPFSKLD